MLDKSLSFAREMGCFSCFGFSAKPKRQLNHVAGSNQSLDLLLDDEVDYYPSDGEFLNTVLREEEESHSRTQRPVENLKLKMQNGLTCRQFPAKETFKLIRSEDEHGNKMLNEYVRERKIGSGAYGKVVLYRSTRDGKQYAIKVFRKSHLLKIRVAPSETALSDVYREVLIMKFLEHPNIVNLIEVIDDQNNDNLYLVLEFVESKLVCEGFGDTQGIGDDTARTYLRDLVSGLLYLHAHNIVHGDIKPDNLLITSNGIVKIGDFNVSQVIEDDNDELRRSPGTPVFTAPECCLGLTYNGKVADTWAVGVTLYCMIFGKYPFLGETHQDTYDKIVNDPLILPDNTNSELRNLLEGLLCKDPNQRITMKDTADHAWVVGEYGPIPQFSCWCKRNPKGEEETNGIYNT